MHEVVNDACVGLIEGRKEFVDTFEHDDKYLYDELISVDDSDAEINDDENYPQYNKKAKSEHVILEIGMEFANLDTFKDAIRDYNINLGKLVSF